MSFGKNIIGTEMRATLKLTASVAYLILAPYSVQGIAAAPSFDEFREPIIRLNSSVKPRIVSSQDREFKTKIIEASKLNVNFAGHYILSSFGCGASCVMSFALDKESGEITWLPFTVCCSESVETGVEPLAFKKDSRLLVITGSRDEQGKGIYYYEFKHGQFISVHQVER